MNCFGKFQVEFDWLFMKLNLLVNLRDISKKWRILQDKRFIYGSIFDQTYENGGYSGNVLREFGC